MATHENPTIRNSLEHDLKICRILFQQFNDAMLRAIRNMDMHPETDGRCKIPKILLIQETVAAHFGLPVTVMASPIRTTDFVMARQVAMYLCRELTDYSSVSIAECFRKGHGSVLNASVRMANLVSNESKLANEVAGLRTAIAQRLQKSDQPILAFTA